MATEPTKPPPCSVYGREASIVFEDGGSLTALGWEAYQLATTSLKLPIVPRSGTFACEIESDSRQLELAIKKAQAIVEAATFDVDEAKAFLPFAYKLRDAIRRERPRTITRREPRK